MKCTAAAAAATTRWPLLRLLLLCISLGVFSTPAVQARTMHRKHHGHHYHIALPPGGAQPPWMSPPPLLPPSPPPSPPPAPIFPPPSPPLQPAPVPSPSNDVFDVRTLGAVGDGVTDDSLAFRYAWEYACQVESGTILVPKGYTFMVTSIIFAGPCQKGIRFQIEGSIVPPDGPDLWPQNTTRRNWLVFYRADNIVFRGNGLVDGRGEKWWKLPCKPHMGPNGRTSPGPCDSPVALRFFLCSNVTLRGLGVRDSPQFHIRFDNCRNIVVDNVTITAPAFSPNTDGIHVENTVSVGIYNSAISNGDDCISIGSGTMDVFIHNVTCGPGGHGISIGSLGKLNSRACVRNITVDTATIKLSDNGVRIKTWQGGAGSVSGVAFRNVFMDTVRNPIIIDQYYCLDKPCPNATNAVLVADVVYDSIRGTYDVRAPPMHFGCSDAVPCINVTLTDIELLPAKGDIILDPFCWNVYGGMRSLTIPPVSCLLDGLPRSIMETDTDRC